METFFRVKNIFNILFINYCILRKKIVYFMHKLFYKKEQNLMNYVIEQDNCVGCGRCAKACPADAIQKTDYIAPGKKLPSYQIDTTKCVKCGACMATCRPKAITKK